MIQPGPDSEPSCDMCGRPLQAGGKNSLLTFEQGNAEHVLSYRICEAWTCFHEATGRVEDDYHDIYFAPALKEITRLGEEFPTPVAVCITHRRFVPCRSADSTCALSQAPWDVERVRRHQQEGGG
jgi:hypothetical protein